MVILVFVLCLSVLVARGQISEDEVDYYERLVNENINAAQNYVSPVDAKQYQGNYYTASESQDVGTFDFIVIGSGSTGGPLAARLSEISHWKILLLELGTFENNFTDIPGLYFYSRFSDYNWGFVSTPQEGACLGMVNKQCPFTRGKAVGGSTVVNGLIYSRGNRHDFDQWSLLAGGGWSYKEVLPYFKKIDDTQFKADPHYYGKNGPFPLTYPKPISPQTQAFLDANVEAGRKILQYNGRHQKGFSRMEVNIKEGRRVSTGNAYLFPALKRKNLRLLTGSYVTKILFKEKRAVGVEFVRDGKKSKASIKKEVLLCGGVFGSPHILMNSGIGPKEELLKHNITVLKDVGQIGKNLFDHATFYGLHFNTNYTEPNLTVRDYVKQYLNGVGPYTSAANLQAIGYLETKYSNYPGVSDVELLLSAAGPPNLLAQQSFRFTDTTYSKIFEKVNPYTSFLVYIVLSRPRSSGQVTIKSNNPFDFPVINPKFLTDAEDLDVKTIYEGVQETLALLKTKSLQSLNTTLIEYVLPACNQTEYFSEEFWFCHIRQITMNVYHPVGTCKMGLEKNGGVVDKHLKVYGLHGLRVADASVFPFAFTGHPSLPAIMMGEKLADEIKDEYGVDGLMGNKSTEQKKETAGEK